MKVKVFVVIIKFFAIIFDFMYLQASWSCYSSTGRLLPLSLSCLLSFLNVHCSHDTRICPLSFHIVLNKSNIWCTIYTINTNNIYISCSLLYYQQVTLFTFIFFCTRHIICLLNVISAHPVKLSPLCLSCLDLQIRFQHKIADGSSLAFSEPKSHCAYFCNNSLLNIA